MQKGVESIHFMSEAKISWKAKILAAFLTVQSRESR
jgi:hypothetical protein